MSFRKSTGGKNSSRHSIRRGFRRTLLGLVCAPFLDSAARGLYSFALHYCPPHTTSTSHRPGAFSASFSAHRQVLDRDETILISTLLCDETLCLCLLPQHIAVILFFVSQSLLRYNISAVMTDERYVINRSRPTCRPISPTFSKHVNRFTSSGTIWNSCLLYTSPSPRDGLLSRMPSSA